MTDSASIALQAAQKGADETQSRWALKWPAMVLALTAAAYSGTLAYLFVHDDIDQIVNNPRVHSWRFVPGYFTSHIWSHLSPQWGGVHYRPMFLLWLLINHTLFELHPLWWHLSTVIAHLAATLMVYLLVTKLTRNSLTAAVAAAVFGLHPVHIEAVAWVSGVAEPLLAVLIIGSFLCYLKREDKRRQSGWFAASLLLFAMALLTKETAIVFPVLIFAYEWIFRNEAPGRSRLESGVMGAIPFLVLTLIYLPVRASALKGMGASLTPLPLSTVLLTLPSVLWTYIRLLVWPIGLSAFYDVHYVTGPGVSTFVLPLLAVIAIGIALFLWSRTSRVVAFASVWLLVSIIPVLNLSALLKDEFIHDRYLYLPSVGFSIMVAVAIARLDVSRARLFGLPASQLVPAVAVIGLLGMATAWQHSFWANEFVLFQRGVEVAPSNMIARNNLGNVLMEQGLYAEAAVHLEKSVDRNADSRSANWNLGLSYYQLGRFDEARNYLTHAVELDPGRAEQFVYLALTDIQLGLLNDGRAALQRAKEINQSTPGVHYGLGVALKKEGDLRSALDEFKAEAALNPADVAANSQIAEIESRIQPLRKR